MKNFDQLRLASDTALIFEGGGMRGAFTSAVVVKLIEQGYAFPWVAGISAGASHVANFVSRQPLRARKSFVEISQEPQFGGIVSLLRGKGIFNSDFLYQHTSLPHEPLPHDFETFMANPAEVCISAFRVSDGVSKIWTRKDIKVMKDLMNYVQASSAMPIVMPPVTIDSQVYVDGALGPNGGIPLDQAKAAGYKRFFVVLSQKRNYVKRPVSQPALVNKLLKKYPYVAQALLERHKNYNATREELADLHASGQAFVFYPETMPIKNMEHNITKLRKAHQAGLAQCETQLSQWQDFLGV